MQNHNFQLNFFTAWTRVGRMFRGLYILYLMGRGYLVRQDRRIQELRRVVEGLRNENTLLRNREILFQDRIEELEADVEALRIQLGEDQRRVLDLGAENFRLRLELLGIRFAKRQGRRGD